MADLLGPIQSGECEYMDNLLNAQAEERMITMIGSSHEEKMAIFKDNLEEIAEAQELIFKEGCPSQDSEVAVEMKLRSDAMTEEVNKFYGLRQSIILGH